MKEKIMIRFNFVTNILILLLFIFGAISYADSNGIFIQARDVVPGTFGNDEGAGDFTFPSNLDIRHNLNVLNEINSKILRATNLSISNSFKYGGVELDDRYINENQENSVSSEMIVNGEKTKHKKFSHRNKLKKYGYDRKEYNQRSKVETINSVIKKF